MNVTNEIESGQTRLRLEFWNGSGFEIARWIDAILPEIRSSQRTVIDTPRDLLRAYLHHQMHATLRLGSYGSGMYRIRCGTESVTDRWNGRAMIGCSEDDTHALNCGLFACPCPPSLALERSRSTAAGASAAAGARRG